MTCSVLSSSPSPPPLYLTTGAASSPGVPHNTLVVITRNEQDSCPWLHVCSQECRDCLIRAMEASLSLAWDLGVLLGESVKMMLNGLSRWVPMMLWKKGPVLHVLTRTLNSWPQTYTYSRISPPQHCWHWDQSIWAVRYILGYLPASLASTHWT